MPQRKQQTHDTMTKMIQMAPVKLSDTMDNDSW